LCLDSLHNVVLCVVVVVIVAFFLLVLDIDLRYMIITWLSKRLGDDLPLSVRQLSLQLRSDPENIIQLSD
jgi:hypothetical protein